MEVEDSRVVAAVSKANRETLAAYKRELNGEWLLSELWSIVASYAVPHPRWKSDYTVTSFFDVIGSRNMQMAPDPRGEIFTISVASLGSGVAHLFVANPIQDDETIKVWVEMPSRIGETLLQIGSTLLKRTEDHRLKCTTLARGTCTAFYVDYPASSMTCVELTRKKQIVLMRFCFVDGQHTHWITYDYCHLPYTIYVGIYGWTLDRNTPIKQPNWSIALTASPNYSS